MFGVCMWYRYVGWMPNINEIIMELQQKLKSFPFQAHITIRSCVSASEKSRIIAYYRSIPAPYFTVGPLKQTVTMGDKGGKFFALQRDLYLNGSTMQVSTYHISFAYRDTQFTEDEMNVVKLRTSFIHKILGKDLSLELWQCNGHPSKWYKL